MKKMKQLLLAAFTAVMVITGGFSAAAEVEENTLTAEINGTSYTFYLDKAEDGSKLFIQYFSLDANGNKDFRINLQRGVTGRGEWGLVLDTRNHSGTDVDIAGWIYVGIDKDMTVNLASQSNDGTSCTGTLEVRDLKCKGAPTVNITGGEFNYTLGTQHAKIAALDSQESSNTSGNKKNSSQTNRSKSNSSTNNSSKSSGSNRQNPSYDDRNCNFCAGLGECDECFGSGSISCDTCFGSGICQRCYGQGGEYRYTMSKIKWIKCSSCNQSGSCSRCKGAGYKTCTHCSGTGNCRYCGGDGIR